MEAFKLTHLIFSSTGTMDNDEGRIKKLYKYMLPRVKELGKSCGLDTAACYTNLFTFYKDSAPPYVAFSYFFAAALGSIAFALQKLFDVYYHSSAYSYDELNLKNLQNYGGTLDGSFFDIYTLPSISTENITFYSCGTEAERVEKEAAISDFGPAQKYLSVCSTEYDGGDNKGAYNCSHCKKCLRTMSGLYALGKLDNFRAVFDVDGFKAGLGRNIGWWLSLEHGVFVKEFMNCCRKNHVHVPLSAYFWKYIFLTWRGLTYLLKDSVLARKICYKLRLDYLVKGFRNSIAEVKYKDII